MITEKELSMPVRKKNAVSEAEKKSPAPKMAEKPKEVIRIKTSSQNESVAISDGTRPVYAAKCATCDIDIEVPFKPDASRPTFCKDCLKDYQRQQAKIQQAKLQSGSKASSSSRRNNSGGRGVPGARPISMNQAARMAPRPFKENRERKKKQVNLSEVRALIKESLQDK